MKVMQPYRPESPGQWHMSVREFLIIQHPTDETLFLSQAFMKRYEATLGSKPYPSDHPVGWEDAFHAALFNDLAGTTGFVKFGRVTRVQITVKNLNPCR